MITFDPIEHKYYNSQGVEYISVSKLISKYKQPFDDNYWSLYKAIEELIISKYTNEIWLANKKGINKSTIESYITNFKLGLFEVRDKQEQILARWKDISDEACFKGNLVHEQKEKEIIEQGGKKLTVVNKDNLTSFFIGSDIEVDIENVSGIFPEMKLFNDEYCIAGTSDKVTIEDGYVDIDDHKTNKKIDTVSFRNKDTGYQMMNFPLNHLMDSNYFHYNLQTSIYMYMLEAMGFKPRNLQITHIIRKEVDGLFGKEIVETQIPYKFSYLKREVQSILNIRKKELNK